MSIEDILLALVMTILFYVPIPCIIVLIFYREGIQKKKLVQIISINNALVWVILSLISYMRGKNQAASIGIAVFWGFITYAIMRVRILKDVTLQCEGTGAKTRKEKLMKYLAIQPVKDPDLIDTTSKNKQRTEVTEHPPHVKQNINTQTSFTKHKKTISIKPRKLALSVFLAGTLFMCVFFVPQNINYTVISSQNVPHTVVTNKIYAPIWYNYPGSTREQNQVDIQRLSIQMAVLTIICGVIYMSFKE